MGDAEETVYRSRWDICDECETVTILQREGDQGVPDNEGWEEFPRCMVCGGSLTMGNADEKTQSDIEYAKGRASRQRTVEGLYRLVEHLASEMSVGDQCEVAAGQTFGRAESSQCPHTSVAIRWESGFTDLVCEEHAQTARARKTLVVYPKAADGTSLAKDLPEVLA